MIKWEFFEKRRNIDLSVWIKDANIENYEQLVEILDSKGVEPPPKSYFQAAYAVAVPKIEKVAPVTEEPKEDEIIDKKPELRLERRSSKRKKQK